MLPEKQKGNAKKTAKRLFSYVAKGHKVQIAVVLACIIISALAQVAGSLFLQILIDDYITPLLSVENPVFTGLIRMIMLMVGIFAIGVITNYLFNRIMAIIGQSVQRKIRDQMFSKMQKLPISYFDTHNHGDIMSCYTNDIDTLRQMISQGLPQILSMLVSVISIFCAMVYLNLILTALVIIMLVVILTVIRMISGKSAKFFIRQQDMLGKANGYIEEMINGQKVVKVFCHEEEAKKGFDQLNEALFESAEKANTYANFLMPAVGNLGHLQYVLLAIVGGILAVNGIGGISLGTIASFLQMSRSFTNPIGQISMQLNSVIMALAGAERIFRLMDEKPEEDYGYVTLVNVKYKGGELVETSDRTNIWAWKHPHQDGAITYTRLTGDVRFYDVDFGYEENKIVLHDISIYAEPGQKIAFVGATGAGKTTITNLINRFYDIADGKIRYDGININKIRKSDLRRSLGVVLQDTHLFTGTILENIRYGRLGADDEEVYAAAQLANAHDFITRLPNGYETVITGDGASLSQGQRQLIAIARAAVADPPVMILDEATSSIDTRTEIHVQQGMDSLMYGRTVFVIAHRLSTIQNSNVIMVMDQGRIIERGNHEQLIGQKGKYYQLYTGVFELE